MVEASKNKFKEVFEKLELSGNVAKEFASAEVCYIKVFTKDKKMNIALNHNRLIKEQMITSLKDELQSRFPIVRDIDIQVKYLLAETNTEAIIKSYWENILYSVRASSPACHYALKNAEWFYSGNCLRICVRGSCMGLLAYKGISKKIQNMLNENFALDIRVVFEQMEELDGQYEQRLKIKERELVQNVILNMPQETAPIKADIEKPKKQFRSKIKVGGVQNIPAQKLSENIEPGTDLVVCGRIFELEQRETKSGKLLTTFDITDTTNSITIKFFSKPEDYGDELKAILKKGNTVMVKGKAQFDDFSKELNIMAFELSAAKLPERMDRSGEKRVELHLHTQMSSMDGVTSVTEYIKRAAKWGHKALAITDHGIVQAFPEAMDAAKKYGIKILYGVEAYLVDDLGAVVSGVTEQDLQGEFVVFDLETTGLSKENDKIIEIGAVKIRGAEIIDKFSTFVNPYIKLPEKIKELTGIGDEMLIDAPGINEVLPEFLKFIGNGVLVAHNASFDVGFIKVAAKGLSDVQNCVLDTVELAKTLFPELGRYKLNIVAGHLGVSLENHHRAVDDAMATAEIFIKCIDILAKKGLTTLQDINVLASRDIDKKKLKYYHAIILAKNYTGLRNLYELISKSHMDYFYKRPRIPKSDYIKLKEGLIIGTACEAGEFYKAILEKQPEAVISKLAEFYDYFEIQPTGNNMYLVRSGKVESEKELQDINKKIVDLGRLYNKPVAATCDVHFIDPEDEVFRRIIMAGEGFSDADLQAPLYFRTTEEMLGEFEYLGSETAHEVVIKNTNLIAEMIEEIKPIPDETFPPKIEGAEQQIADITMNKAREIYGENLPQLVKDRLDRELNSIIKNGFSVMYIIAQKLVWKSLEDGYLVGSRGSVGSSFVATMSGITEVNPLPPHYLCPSCKYSDFDSELVRSYAGASGCDMPDMNCPVCGKALSKDGHDIPFETFLGFDGDKEPDIDLNFSGEYQAKAHAYTEYLFGEGHVFKAGTIGTLADKTAYGYVRKYLEERNISARNAEINRLKIGCTGIKRTTGQHPGGLMIVPNGHSIYEFCPVQHPANDTGSNVTTTHFDYHSISGRLLKLDILGHDVPTIIRMLHDITGVDPRMVDLGDKDTISLFTSPKALGVTPEEIRCKTGSLGLPEFGTNFVRQMLLDTQPHSFAELVRISGLSHGTDVWFNNAQELIKNKTATLKEVIPTRDDIMVYLINKGVEKKAAFKIMENVRKGKGLKDDEVATMKAANVDDWYIESCRRIKYMFPKGHAVAYVMMTIRIAYFKIHYPYSFYASSFSVKAEDFDYEIMCHGKEKVIKTMDKIVAMGKEASAKDKNTLTLLELVLEMYARGLKFVALDLYRADAAKFKVMPEGLMPPLSSVQGLGGSVAQNIVEARKDGEFMTIEDFRGRTKTNKTVIELLKSNKILEGIPETNQLSLF